MRSHYRQRSSSRNLKISGIYTLSEAEAYETLKQIRFARSKGQPVCPRCDCERISLLTTRRSFKCRECKHQFTVVSGTVWARSKLPYQKLLLLAARFAMSAQGTASLTLAHELECNPMTAFVAFHKIREAMFAAQKEFVLEGVCEIDGAIFGGYVKPPNDRRITNYPRKNEKKKVLGIVVERRLRGKGRSLAVVEVVRHERELIPFARRALTKTRCVHTDMADHWKLLADTTVVKSVSHKDYYSTEKLPVVDGFPSKLERACTNNAENYFSRVRRAEDLHVHISGPYLDLYGAEQAWRHAHCRTSDAERYLAILELCLTQGVSRRFGGYWQRRRAP